MPDFHCHLFQTYMIISCEPICDMPLATYGSVAGANLNPYNPSVIFVGHQAKCARFEPKIIQSQL